MWSNKVILLDLPSIVHSLQFFWLPEQKCVFLSSKAASLSIPDIFSRPKPYPLKNQQFASLKKDGTGRRSILSFVKKWGPFLRDLPVVYSRIFSGWNPNLRPKPFGGFLSPEVVDEPSYASARLVDDEGSSLTTWAANCRTGFRSIQAENTDCDLAFVIYPGSPRLLKL